MRRATLPLALLLVAILARASSAQERPPLAPPSVSAVVGAPSGVPLQGDRLDAATKAVASVLRCPVCQGSSVWDSPATMAVNMKRQVRELLADGYDQEQVLQYFEASYGEFVLLSPPKNGIALVVWILPGVFLVVGAGVIWRLTLPVPLPTNELHATIALGVSPRRMSLATMVGGFIGVGVIGALLLLANATATSRSPVVRTTVPTAEEPDAGSRISGVIKLDSSGHDVRYPAIVFVYARPENLSAGAPVAALRLEVSSFPVVFSLGPEHVMMGGALPPKVRIEARIDPDGNVSTREPEARHGFIDRVELGTTDLRILLK